MGRNFDDYPGFQPMRSWANTYAQDCSSLCQSGEEIAYLLQVQVHFEIDALNMVSAIFEITKIFSTLQVTLAMKH